jgi:proteasome lid subunit RPN8/RPN11
MSIRLVFHILFHSRSQHSASSMGEMDEQMLEPCEVVADDSDEGSEIDPLCDPDERRVLFAALDSFR